MVERLFLTVQRGCLQFVIVVFPDHTLLLFLMDVIILMDCVETKHVKGADQPADQRSLISAFVIRS